MLVGFGVSASRALKFTVLPTGTAHSPNDQSLEAAQSGSVGNLGTSERLLFRDAAFQHLYTACELGLHELLDEQPHLTAGEIRHQLRLADRP
jgi:hypothetical protein